MLFSCDKEYVYDTEIRIENDSQHDIEIIMPELWLDGSVFPEKIMLPRGQSFSHIITGEGGFVGVPYFPSMLIRFDNDISITHVQSDGNAYHNFCNGQAYTRKQKNKQHEIFTLIFTDEDYEYAVQHTNKADYFSLLSYPRGHLTAFYPLRSTYSRKFSNSSTNKQRGLL